MELLEESQKTVDNLADISTDVAASGEIHEVQEDDGEEGPAEDEEEVKLEQALSPDDDELEDVTTMENAGQVGFGANADYAPEDDVTLAQRLNYIQAARSTQIGTGVTGPNTIVRICMALRSGLDAEMDWALIYLLRISHEKPTSMRLDYISGLTEALINKIATILQVKKQGSREDKILEAGLVLRNLCIVPDNGRYLARLPHLHQPLLDVATQQNSRSIELRSYCLDILDSISSHVQIDNDQNPFYTAMAECTESADRTTLITGLRCLVRFAINDPSNKLTQNIDAKIVTRVSRLLYLDDERLLNACLDFLYQWTTYAKNLRSLMDDTKSLRALGHQLVRLMTFKAENRWVKYPQQADIDQSWWRSDDSEDEEHREPDTTTPPPLPDKILNQLLALEEPQRAIQW